jgi:hypothetical protein
VTDGRRVTDKGSEVFGIALRSFSARKDHKSVKWRWMESSFAVDPTLAVSSSGSGAFD